MEKTYYKAKNGLEYPEIGDAIKYGGGAVAKRVHRPIKAWEPIYEEIKQEETKTENFVNVQNPEVDTPAAVNEYDGMDKDQLKAVLRSKGYPIKGNPSEETLREKLKLLGN